MSLSVKVSSFSWLAADAATTTYDVTLGFQPAFAIVWMSGIPGTTDAVTRGAIRQAIGFIKDGTTRAGVLYGSADASAAAAYGVAHGTTSVLLTSSTSSATINGRLDVDAKANWPADGIRFVVDTQGTNDRRVSILAVGGSDITGVTVGSFQEAAATGNQTIAHGLGTTPTGVLFASCGLGTAPESAANTGAMCFSLGAFDGTNSWATTLFGNDQAASMQTVSYAKTGEVLAMGVEGITTDARATGVSLDGTNITINWTERAGSRYVIYLAWVGGLFKATSTTTATNTTQFSGPTLGYVPKAALFASACRAASTADTPTPHSQLSLGAATSASERVAQAVLDEDGPADAEVTFALETDAVYANISTASAIQGLMDVVDMTVDPMQLVMDDADPSASFVGVAAWGTSAGTDFPETASSGSLSKVGVAASFLLALSLSAGSYAVTGAAASPTIEMTASAGSYSATGVDATLAHQAGTTLVVELRQGATLIATRTLSPGLTAETFQRTLTTPERDAVTDWAALRYAFIADGETVDVTWAALWTPSPTLDVQALSGTYTLTPSAATLVADFFSTASAGTLAATGVAASPVGDLFETLSSGSLTATGADASLLAAYVFEASSGTYATTGASATDVHSVASQATFVTASGASTNAATSLSVTIAAPAAAGDLALVVVAHRGGSGGIITASSPGWAAVAPQQNATVGGVLGTRIFSKLLTSGDIGASHSFAFNTASNVKGSIVSVVARGTNIAIVASAHQTNASQPQIPIPGLTLSPQGVLLVAVGSKSNDQAHVQLSGWTLDPSATAASSGGTLASRNRVSAQYRSFSGQNPPGLLITAGASGASSTGHQIAIGASANLTASPEVFASNGTDADLSASFPLTASPAAMTIAGASATLGPQLTVSADSYAITGAAATFSQTYVLSAEPGFYTSTGRQASLEFIGSYDIAAEPGQYTSTGAASTTVPPSLTATAGSYSSTGQAESVTLQIPAIADSYTSGGSAADTVAAYTLTAVAGTYTVTGPAAIVAIADGLQAGSYAVSPSDASVAFAATAEDGVYLVTGTVAGLEIEGGFTSSALPGLYASAGFDAALVVAELFTASAGSVSQTGIAIGVALAAEEEPGSLLVNGSATTSDVPALTASAGSYTTAGAAATPAALYVTVLDPQPYTVTGSATSVEFVERVTLADPGSYSTTGHVADLVLVGVEETTVDPGAYSLNSAAASLTPDLSLTASPGSFTTTGTAAIFSLDRPLTADAGAYTTTGTAATLQIAPFLTASAGSYIITGKAAEADLVSAAEFIELVGSYDAAPIRIAATASGAVQVVASAGAAITAAATVGGAITGDGSSGGPIEVAASVGEMLEIPATINLPG